MDRNRRRGFSLIELLVVVAIVAILAAILVPVFDQARKKGLQTTCASNLKQLGVAIAQYLGDNGQKYPVTYFNAVPSSGWQYYGWKRAINRYVKNKHVMYCPMKARYKDWWVQYTVEEAANLGIFELLEGYCANGHVFGPGNSANESEIRKPSKLLLIGELIPRRFMETNAGWIYWIDHKEPRMEIGYHHSDGQNQLFADTHVRWKHMKDISSQYASDPEYNGSYLGWKTPNAAP